MSFLDDPKQCSPLEFHIYALCRYQKRSCGILAAQ